MALAHLARMPLVLFHPDSGLCRALGFGCWVGGKQDTHRGLERASALGFALLASLGMLRRHVAEPRPAAGERPAQSQRAQPTAGRPPDVQGGQFWVSCLPTCRPHGGAQQRPGRPADREQSSGPAHLLSQAQPLTQVTRSRAVRYAAKANKYKDCICSVVGR